MDIKMIAYEFSFNVAVQRANGKVYHNHKIIGLGLGYSEAVWDVFFKLKKRKTRIIRISSVRPLRVAFAFDADGNSIKTTLEQCPPAIPEDLNGTLQKL